MSKPATIIVPARLESSRFPRKLMHRVLGKPIILWTAERIASVAPQFPLVFAVDHSILSDCLEAAGFNCIQTRPEHSSGTDRLAEANRSIGAERVINVQADEPLVSAEHIAALVAGLDAGADMATLAIPFDREEDFRNPNQVKVVRDHRGFALYFSRAAIPHDRDGSAGALGGGLRHLGLYAYSADCLQAFSGLKPSPLEQIEKLEQLRALEQGFRIFVGLSQQPSIGIDTAADVRLFEQYLTA